MVECIYGSGGFSDVVGFIEKVLDERGGFKKKVFGRIVEYRAGFHVKLVLVYYRSDGTFKICGDRGLINHLRERARLYGSGIKMYDHLLPSRIPGEAGVHDEVFELLVERQRLEGLTRHCRMDGIILALLALIAALFDYLVNGDIPDMTLAASIIIAAGVLLPRPHMVEGRIGFYHPLRCPSYRSQLRMVDGELRRMLILLPRDNPYRRIIELQLSGKG